MSASEKVMPLTDSESNESSWTKIEDVGIVQLYVNEPWAHTNNEDEDYEEDQHVLFPVGFLD